MVPLWTLGVLGPQFLDTIYISEVNKATKVESDAQIAIGPMSGA